MYIALRWLIGLSFAMWVAVCGVQFYTESYKGSQYNGFIETLFKTKNISNPIKKGIEPYGRKSINPQHQDTAFLHYAMFFAGALAVSVFNRKKEIILYTRRKILLLNTLSAVFLRDTMDLKRTALTVSVAVVKYITIFWEDCKNILKNYIKERKMLQTHKQKLVRLSTKLQEYEEERKKLGHLYTAAIRENKNIRMRYHFQTSAKKRLLQNIEDTQKQVKENRSKYVTFQRLYLVTHQENIYLKNRLKKVSKEKEDAEQNFISLVNEIYQSNSKDLKAYCRRLMVETRENIINSNLHSEIKVFLQNNAVPSDSHQNSSGFFDLEADTRVTEILPGHETLVPIGYDAPKLKGLPGECIWTVKDKDGIIEKLYECDYETDFDNGDTVQRIRKYTVYHDKDCLLDFTNSRTTVCDLNNTNTSVLRQQYIKVECPIINHRFLTGSQVFQKFLQDNQNLIHLKTSQKPALL